MPRAARSRRPASPNPPRCHERAGQGRPRHDRGRRHAVHGRGARGDGRRHGRRGHAGPVVGPAHGPADARRDRRRAGRVRGRDARSFAQGRRARGRHRRGRDRRRRQRHVQHLDHGRARRGRRGHPGREARQPGDHVSVRRRRRPRCPRASGSTTTRRRPATRCDPSGFAFLFAPVFHPAMRHAGPTRKEIGVRTAFNLLGPLTNPAGTTRGVIGVGAPEVADKVAQVARRLGTERTFVIHGAGVDELPLDGTGVIHDVTQDGIESRPRHAGAARPPLGTDRAPRRRRARRERPDGRGRPARRTGRAA